MQIHRDKDRWHRSNNHDNHTNKQTAWHDNHTKKQTNRQENKQTEKEKHV